MSHGHLGHIVSEVSLVLTFIAATPAESGADKGGKRGEEEEETSPRLSCLS